MSDLIILFLKELPKLFIARLQDEKGRFNACFFVMLFLLVAIYSELILISMNYH